MTPRQRLSFTALPVLCALWLGLHGRAQAHELEHDRLTVVQREPRHLSLQFYVEPLGLMQRTLAPQQPRAEFLAALVAQGPAETEKAWQQVQARFTDALQLRLGSTPLRLSGWRFPSGKSLHAQLQQRLMRQTVTPQAHVHEEPAVIAVEAVADRDIPNDLDTRSSPLTVALPPALEPLMLVSYRPQQRWVDGKTGPVPIAF